MFNCRHISTPDVLVPFEVFVFAVRHWFIINFMLKCTFSYLTTLRRTNVNSEKRQVFFCFLIFFLWVYIFYNASGSEIKLLPRLIKQIRKTNLPVYFFIQSYIVFYLLLMSRDLSTFSKLVPPLKVFFFTCSPLFKSIIYRLSRFWVHWFSSKDFASPRVVETCTRTRFYLL